MNIFFTVRLWKLFNHLCIPFSLIVKVKQISSHSECSLMSWYIKLSIRTTYLKINVFPNQSDHCTLFLFLLFLFPFFLLPLPVSSNYWWYLCWWNPSLGVTFPHMGIIHPSIKRFAWVIMMCTITLSCSSSFRRLWQVPGLQVFITGTEYCFPKLHRTFSKQGVFTRKLHSGRWSYCTN